MFEVGQEVMIIEAGAHFGKTGSISAKLADRNEFMVLTYESGLIGPILEDDLIATPATHAEVIAKVFAVDINRAVSSEEWNTIRHLNATEPYKSTAVCASHEFVDANESMEYAFQLVMGRPAGGQIETFVDNDNADNLLWNEAWQIAKVTYLTAKEGE